MKNRKFSSITEDELKSIDIDICIVASGYESRSRALATSLEKNKIRILSKFAWGFKEYNQEKVRLKNDSDLKKLGYEITPFSGSDSETPYKIIRELLLSYSEEQKVTFLFDISSMSRTWYAAIIQALAHFEFSVRVRTIFAYIPAVWKQNSSSFPPNEILAPLPGYSSHALPNKPTALVIGLGSESQRSIGLKEHLDPQLLICFFTNPGIDQNYENSVLSANQDLLENMSENNIYAYNIYDTFGTYITLESVINGLTKDYRVVLASLGPKIFGIYCLLISIANPSISVWRVSPATRQEPIDEKPTKKGIFFAIDWE